MGGGLDVVEIERGHIAGMGQHGTELLGVEVQLRLVEVEPGQLGDLGDLDQLERMLKGTRDPGALAEVARARG